MYWTLVVLTLGGMERKSEIVFFPSIDSAVRYSMAFCRVGGVWFDSINDSDDNTVYTVQS